MGAGGRGRDEDDGKEGQAAGAGLKGMWKEGRGCRKVEAVEAEKVCCRGNKRGAFGGVNVDVDWIEKECCNGVIGCETKVAPR